MKLPLFRDKLDRIINIGDIVAVGEVSNNISVAKVTNITECSVVMRRYTGEKNPDFDWHKFPREPYYLPINMVNLKGQPNWNEMRFTSYPEKKVLILKKR